MGVAVTVGTIDFSVGNGRINGVSVTATEVLLSARANMFPKNRNPPKANIEIIITEAQ